MSATKTQLSTSISLSTLEKLGRFAEASGLQEGVVVEQALLAFLDAPGGSLIPQRLVLEEEEFERLAALLAAPPAATPEALRELMRDDTH